MQEIWTENGDMISRQYAGTDAMKVRVFYFMRSKFMCKCLCYLAGFYAHWKTWHSRHVARWQQLDEALLSQQLQGCVPPRGH